MQRLCLSACLSVVCIGMPLSAQDTINPRALPDSELPSRVPDSPEARQVARALARFVCRDTAASPRVIPYIPYIEPTLMQRVPDIAPGVLGTFFSEVAVGCMAPVADSGRATVVQFVGMRAAASNESTYVFWQQTYPLVDGRWSVEVMRGVVLRSSKDWPLISPTVIRRDHFVADK